MGTKIFDFVLHGRVAFDGKIVLFTAFYEHLTELYSHLKVLEKPYLSRVCD
jgi:hypothetical protein